MAEELVATGVAAGGEAVAHGADGRVVFVAGALPGERVKVELVEEHPRWARARLVGVLEPSDDRREPPCPHVDRGCGGCAWQHVAPEAQAVHKRTIVVDALERLGGIAEPIVEIGPRLPAADHRTTVRLAAAGAGSVGYRRARSHEVVDVDSCHIAHPTLQELIVEGTFDDAEEVVLRCGARTGDRLVMARPTASGVRVPDGVVVVGADELRAGRRAWIHEEAAGRRWRISASSFFQSSPQGAEALVAVVEEMASPSLGHVVDAYGGVGLFAGTVAAADREVTLVERSASAAADARINLAGRKARVLRLDVGRWRPKAAGLVVADPSRTGLGRHVVDILVAAGAPVLVLVSCDPAALGRDAALLGAAGYQPERTVVVDLFPHTPHVEAVTRFRRG